MKLILQIALGVFIGISASQLLIDAWRTHRQEQVAQAENAERDQIARERREQSQKIRELVSEKLQRQAAEQTAESMAPDVMPQEPEGEEAPADAEPEQP